MNQVTNRIACRTSDDNQFISSKLPRQYAVIVWDLFGNQRRRLVKAWISKAKAIRIARRWNQAAKFVGQNGVAQVFRISCRVNDLPVAVS